jgi:hypothetical protein
MGLLCGHKDPPHKTPLNSKGEISNNSRQAQKVPPLMTRGDIVSNGDSFTLCAFLKCPKLTACPLQWERVLFSRLLWALQRVASQSQSCRGHNLTWAARWGQETQGTEHDSASSGALTLCCFSWSTEDILSTPQGAACIFNLTISRHLWILSALITGCPGPLPGLSSKQFKAGSYSARAAACGKPGSRVFSQGCWFVCPRGWGQGTDKEPPLSCCHS